jgi:hypothetical protein
MFLKKAHFERAETEKEYGRQSAYGAARVSYEACKRHRQAGRSRAAPATQRCETENRGRL